jgi:UDP-glucuronate decarboxylase
MSKTKSPIIRRKNILVTGGAGFIGSHLCDALVKENHVICLDNFSTSTVANIEHLLQNPNFEFINHDIVQPFDLLNYSELERFNVRVQGIQEIYHLACPISKRHFEDFKIATVLTNSVGVKNVLDVAVQYQAKILYASSSVLYGPRRPDHLFVSEIDPCVIDHLTPHGAYDEGKRFSEAILQTYADVYNLDVKITRIFRAYGPRMKISDGNMLPDLINAALDGKDLEIHASEDAHVSLCYVSDIIDGMVKHMNSSIDVTVVNLGSDEDLLLSSLAERIIRSVGAPVRIRFEPSHHPMVEAGLPNITKARQVLHWLPLVRLEDGLEKMIDYARSRRQQTTDF